MVSSKLEQQNTLAFRSVAEALRGRQEFTGANGFVFNPLALKASGAAEVAVLTNMKRSTHKVSPQMGMNTATAAFRTSTTNSKVMPKDKRSSNGVDQQRTGSWMKAYEGQTRPAWLVVNFEAFVGCWLE